MGVLHINLLPGDCKTKALFSKNRYLQLLSPIVRIIGADHVERMQRIKVAYGAQDKQSEYKQKSTEDVWLGEWHDYHVQIFRTARKPNCSLSPMKVGREVMAFKIQECRLTLGNALDKLSCLLMTQTIGPSRQYC